MFRFIHAADLHLDSPLTGLERYEGAPVDRVRQATRRTLENLVSLALEQEVAFVLLAGDLYDGDWRDFQTGLFFVSQMVKLRDAGIPVYVIAGNHDAANRMTKSLPLPDNVHMLSAKKPQTMHLEKHQVAIHGQGFATVAVLDDLSAGYPAAVRGWFNVGLLHTSANGREGHERYAPCTVEGLRSKNYDYWALGHVHQREVLHTNPPIIFPGNTQGRHIRETGAKGCMVVTVTDDGGVRPDLHALDVLRWQSCRVDAASAETGDDVLDRFDTQLRQLWHGAEERLLAVRVEVVGACKAHAQLASRPQHWANTIRSRAVDVSSGDAWVEKVHLRTTLPHDAEHDLNADIPVHALIHYIQTLRADDEQLLKLSGEFADLKKKLPSDLMEGASKIDFQSPSLYRDLLGQVQEVLVERLLTKEAGA